MNINEFIFNNNPDTPSTFINSICDNLFNRLNETNTAYGLKEQTEFWNKIKECFKTDLNHFFKGFLIDRLLFNDYEYQNDSLEFLTFKQQFILWLEIKIKKLVNLIAINLNALAQEFNDHSKFNNAIEYLNKVGYSGFELENTNIDNINGTFNITSSKNSDRTIATWYKTINKTISDCWYDLRIDFVNKWIVGIYG